MVKIVFQLWRVRLTHETVFPTLKVFRILQCSFKVPYKFTLTAFTFFLTGLLDMLGHDDLDFTAVMGKVLEEAEPKEAGK